MNAKRLETIEFIIIKTMSENDKIPHFKIALLGSSRVGKTSIVQKCINDQYTLNTISTMQAAFFEKRIHVDKQDIILDVWDTAGQERFHSLAPMYYRDANGIIVVFDITDATSFTKAKQWVNELREARGDKNLEIIVAANKNDLQSLRVVNPLEVQQYAKTERLTICETSAKTGYFIKELFEEIGHRALQHYAQAPDVLIEKKNKKCC